MKISKGSGDTGPLILTLARDTGALPQGQGKASLGPIGGGIQSLSGRVFLPIF